MKILIAYASESGTSEICARKLQEKLPGAALVDLKHNHYPALDAFDAVIVGGGIRMGRLNRYAKRFMENREDILLNKRFGAFICCGGDANAEVLISRNVPTRLAEAALCLASFGGEMVPERMHGMDKWIFRKICEAKAEERTELPHLIPERIDRFAERFLQTEPEANAVLREAEAVSTDKNE